ncbi:hypothetical protein J1605_001350 [Eschrichtius robustus]|uniref:Uncharacterized protein n=1 Tax=Eschrichtius robustus TaxID=9764 RepID=A0AB34G9Y3_ESCRO|nr:hypothetical protein J1605_001350 [Eschrichtius robustus]
MPTLELLKDNCNIFESSGQAAAPEETTLSRGGHVGFPSGLPASAPSVAGRGLKSCPPWRCLIYSFNKHLVDGCHVPGSVRLRARDTQPWPSQAQPLPSLSRQRERVLVTFLLLSPPQLVALGQAQRRYHRV